MEFDMNELIKTCGVIDPSIPQRWGICEFTMLVNGESRDLNIFLDILNGTSPISYPGIEIVSPYSKLKTYVLSNILDKAHPRVLNLRIKCQTSFNTVEELFFLAPRIMIDNRTQKVYLRKYNNSVASRFYHDDMYNEDQIIPIPGFKLSDMLNGKYNDFIAANSPSYHSIKYMIPSIPILTKFLNLKIKIVGNTVSKYPNIVPCCVEYYSLQPREERGKMYHMYGRVWGSPRDKLSAYLEDSDCLYPEDDIGACPLSDPLTVSKTYPAWLAKWDQYVSKYEKDKLVFQLYNFDPNNSH